MNFYRISNPSTYKNEFAVASGFGPFGDMPFLHPKSLQRLNAFWKINPQPPGICIDAGGRKWPDLLANSPPPIYFLSEKIVSDLEMDEIPFSQVTEIPMGENNAKKLKSVPSPKYYVLEAFPGIAVAWDTMGVPTDGYGNAILSPYPKPWPPLVWNVRKSSWSGSDLFTWKNFKSGEMTDLLCTEKVKELAQRKGWTNVHFRPLTAV